MATALKIYTTDENNNAITKTVSNANPAASDYVLKNFSQKLVNLSDSTFRRVERVNTKDITNATDSGGDKSGFAMASSSPFFSTDTDTYVAAFDTLPAISGDLIIRVNLNGGGGRSDVNVSLTNMKNAKNLTGFINLANYAAYNTASGFKYFNASQIANGINIEPTDIYDAEGYYVSSVYFMENENARNENVAAWLKSVGENLISISGYNVTYEELFGTGSMKGIKIFKG